MDFFDHFQLSALFLFYLLFLGRMLQLIVKGTNPLVLGIGEKGIKGALEVCFFFGLLIWTFEVVRHSLHLEFRLFSNASYSLLFEFISLRMAGAALVSAGLLIFAASLVSFGSSWRVGIDTQNPGALVTGGIFSITRNPIFVFLDLYSLGTWLVYPNLFFGISAIVTIVGSHWQILQEEKFLRQQYGEEYQDYLKKTGRYCSCHCVLQSILDRMR